MMKYNAMFLICKKNYHLHFLFFHYHILMRKKEKKRQLRQQQLMELHSSHFLLLINQCAYTIKSLLLQDDSCA